MTTMFVRIAGMDRRMGMITVYDVLTEIGRVGRHTTQERADRHKKIIDDMPYKMPDEWTCVQATEISSLSGQRIKIIGSDVGYQFSRIKLGYRTVRRTVRKLNRERDGTITGEVRWMGRVLLVEYTGLEPWLVDRVLGE